MVKTTKDAADQPLRALLARPTTQRPTDTTSPGMLCSMRTSSLASHGQRKTRASSPSLVATTPLLLTLSRLHHLHRKRLLHLLHPMRQATSPSLLHLPLHTLHLPLLLLPHLHLLLSRLLPLPLPIATAPAMSRNPSLKIPHRATSRNARCLTSSRNPTRLKLVRLVLSHLLNHANHRSSAPRAPTPARARDSLGRSGS